MPSRQPAEDSAWREILNHFSGATQIGLTATPKETEYVSNTEYFGEPVFTYSLKQGISDGFLAPYKVICQSRTKMGPLPGVIPGHGRGYGERLGGARGPNMPDACQGALAEGQFLWGRGFWRSGVGCAALTD